MSRSSAEENSAARRGLTALARAFVLGIALLAGGPAAAIEFSVSPPRLYVDFTNGRGQGKLEVQNRSASDMTMSVSISDFRLDKSNRVEAVAPTADSFSNWLVVNPVEFDVPSGRTRTIRFAVRPLQQPVNGEYKAMIWFTQGAESRPGTVAFNVAFGVPIYATYGQVERLGTLHGVQRQGDDLVFDVSSNGTAHARLGARWAAFPSGGFPGDEAAAEAMQAQDWQAALKSIGARASGFAPSTAVFPGERRRLRRPAPEAGRGGVVFVGGALGDLPLARSFRY